MGFFDTLAVHRKVKQVSANYRLYKVFVYYLALQLPETEDTKSWQKKVYLNLTKAFNIPKKVW